MRHREAPPGGDIVHAPPEPEWVEELAPTSRAPIRRTSDRPNADNRGWFASLYGGAGCVGHHGVFSTDGKRGPRSKAQRILSRARRRLLVRCLARSRRRFCAQHLRSLTSHRRGSGCWGLQCSMFRRHPEELNQAPHPTPLAGPVDRATPLRSFRFCRSWIYSPLGGALVILLLASSFCMRSNSAKVDSER